MSDDSDSDDVPLLPAPLTTGHHPHPVAHVQRGERR
jgi:hypothetical protein